MCEDFDGEANGRRGEDVGDVWRFRCVALFVALRIFVGGRKKIPAAYRDRRQGRIVSVGITGYEPETGAASDMTTDYLRYLARVLMIWSPCRSRAMIVPSGPNRIMHGIPVMP